MNITNELRNALNQIQMLDRRFEKTDVDFETLMVSLSDLYLSVDMPIVEVRRYVDSALCEVEKSRNVFARGDVYEEDLVSIFLDMAVVNIRAAIYYSNK